MDEKDKKGSSQKGKDSLLVFLRRTREGKYARIDESALPYLRMKPQREEDHSQDGYYYSIR